MACRGKGWRGEPRRHGLSARGIRTVRGGVRENFSIAPRGY